MTVASDKPVFELITDMTVQSLERADLDARSLVLIRLAALVAIEAPPASYVANLALAADAGIEVDEVQALLIAVAPIVGTPRVVAAVGSIARGLGVDIESVDGNFST
jgi:alkylhydroperoxidase/carboxymuconolactone decarboxylase family protein YurZ